MVVVVELAPEQEQSPRVAEVPRAGHADGAADSDMDEELAVEVGDVRQGQHPEVGADEGVEAGLLIEDETAHVGVQSVRAADEVETARHGVIELHLAVGRDRGDRVAEDVPDVVASGVFADLSQAIVLISTCLSEVALKTLERFARTGPREPSR